MVQIPALAQAGGDYINFASIQRCRPRLSLCIRYRFLCFPLLFLADLRLDPDTTLILIHDNSDAQIHDVSLLNPAHWGRCAFSFVPLLLATP
jgi:hypothetical protein